MVDIIVNKEYVGRVENGTFFRALKTLGKQKLISFSQASINKALQAGARQVIIHEMKEGLLHMASMQTVSRLGQKYNIDDKMFVGLHRDCMVIIQKEKLLGN